MKKSFLIIVLAAGMFALSGCEKETRINSNDLPSEIKTYVSTHFSENKILQGIEEKENFELTYEVWLEGNITLDFNRKKEITDIESATPLPESVIPKRIRVYVATSYPDHFITSWELDDKNQQVGLDNHVELEFDMNGKFLRIED